MCLNSDIVSRCWTFHQVHILIIQMLDFSSGSYSGRLEYKFDDNLHCCIKKKNYFCLFCFFKVRHITSTLTPRRASGTDLAALLPRTPRPYRPLIFLSNTGSPGDQRHGDQTTLPSLRRKPWMNFKVAKYV